MNSNLDNPIAADSAEEALRLIASLPAPAGLEERVHKALREAPRQGKVLAWPARFRAKVAIESNWMRAAAAAAIVFVVVGGGWGVYTRVEQGQTGKVIVMPLQAPSSGGIQGAGAVRTPTTLPGSKDRERGSEGAREQGTQPAKKLAAPKKRRAQPAASQHPTSQAAPQPAVSR